MIVGNPHYDVVVLGGGVIACEYASTFASLGVKVTMLDKAPSGMSFGDRSFTALSERSMTTCSFS